MNGHQTCLVANFEFVCLKHQNLIYITLMMPQQEALKKSKAQLIDDMIFSGSAVGEEESEKKKALKK